MGYDEILEEQMNTMDFQHLNDIMMNQANSYEILPPLTAQDMINNMVQGNSFFQSDVVIQNIVDLFLFEFKSSILLGVELVTVCIIIGLLKNLSNSFGEKPVSNMGIVVCCCFIIALCLNNFKTTYNMCEDSINTMTLTMQILLPILIPLLIGLGGLTTGSILNPIIISAITVFNTILQKFILPAIFVSTIFILINSMTEKDYVNKLALFLRGLATFGTGLCVTIFAGLTVIQGFVTESADGILINTARYSINNFVPIVGGFAADSVDMVIGCIGVLKNGISIYGVVIIILLLLVPLIKILAIAVVYKVTAIVLEPLGEEKISNCLNEMGNSVITMAVILFLVALMFLIFLTIIIGVGGSHLTQLK